MRWTYLATASGQMEAEFWVDLLKEEGIAALVMPGDTSSFLGVSPNPVRVLVDGSCVHDARRLLAERLREPPESEWEAVDAAEPDG
ncbi:MAG: DUF2007 domain-containing protein [SAR202 cluster bacterium]|nr:DUF2007 domain-containing protein [SAR202 cluster bacterium]